MFLKEHVINNKVANEYLSKQSSEMKALIDLTGEIKTFYFDDPFIALISQIVNQSISMKAAATIWNRLENRFTPITPERILEASYDEIKEVGLSNSKTRYIINVANAFLFQEINTAFETLTDKEVIEELTKIKGIGEWTAQMFLIFCLQREDVISFKDFGIRKGLEWLYDLDRPITKDEFLYYQRLFSPYGTIASHYLWEVHAKTIQKT